MLMGTMAAATQQGDIDSLVRRERADLLVGRSKAACSVRWAARVQAPCTLLYQVQKVDYPPGSLGVWAVNGYSISLMGRAWW